MDPSGGEERRDHRTPTDRLNVLRLIDVGGVQWRRYTLAAGLASPKDDALLVAWNRLLSRGIAAWFHGHESIDSVVAPPPPSPPPTTRPRSTPQPNESTTETTWRRQLWVFWTSIETSAEVQRLVGTELEEIDSGSGVSDGDECHAAMLAAYHCLLTRVLIENRFACVGRWFVKPQLTDAVRNVATPIATATTCAINRDSVLYAFSLFVHGGRWLCAAVDVRLCSALEYLNRSHLSCRQPATEPPPRVLLCPSGVGGTLKLPLPRFVVAAAKDGREAILKEWSVFYPALVPKAAAMAASARRDGGELPGLVEVDVQGIRLLYPSALVLVVNRKKTLRGKSAKGTPSPPGEVSLVGLLDELAKLSWELNISGSAPTTTSSSQQTIVGSIGSMSGSSASSASTSKGFFPHVGSLNKDPCNCGRTKQKSSLKVRGKDAQSALGAGGGHRKGDAPFHRRKMPQGDDVTEKASPSCSNEFGPSVAALAKHVTAAAASSSTTTAATATATATGAAKLPVTSRSTSVLAESPLPSPFLRRSHQTSLLTAVAAVGQSPIQNSVGGSGGSFDPKTFNFDSSLASSRLKGSATQQQQQQQQLPNSTGDTPLSPGKRSFLKKDDYKPTNAISSPSVWESYRLPASRDCPRPQFPLEREMDWAEDDGEPAAKRHLSEKEPAANPMSIDLSGAPDDDDDDEVIDLSYVATTPTPTTATARSTRRRSGSRSRRTSKVKRSEKLNRKGSVSTTTTTKLASSPLSPEPSPVDDVFDGTTATATTETVAATSAKTTSTTVPPIKDFFSHENLVIVGNELDNLFDNDDDGTSNPLAAGGGGGGGGGGGSAVGAGGIVATGKSVATGTMVAPRGIRDGGGGVDACFPTPPSSLEQPSPATADEGSAARSHEQMKGRMSVAVARSATAPTEELKYPVEILKLNEECVVSCLFSAIELPSKGMMPPLKSHSHLTYIPSTQDDENKALNPFTKEPTPILLGGSALTPLPDFKQIVPSGRQLQQPQPTPASTSLATTGRVPRSVVNSVSSPCSHCSTPLPALSDGSGSAATAPPGSLMRHPAVGPLHSHSLLVSLLASSQIHMRLSATYEFPPPPSRPVPASKSLCLRPVRQISEGFDTSAFSSPSRTKNQQMTEVPPPPPPSSSSSPATDLIELFQRHCLASVAFQSQWNGARVVERTSSQTLTPLNDILNGRLIERNLQLGRELLLRHSPFCGSGNYPGSRAGDEDGSLVMTSCIRGEKDFCNKELKELNSLLRRNNLARDGPDTEPLSIEQFERLANTERLSCLKTLPVPAVQVGYDGEIISVSPVALVNWEKLQLEPYSNSHNVIYFAVAPEPLNGVRTFLKQLSQVYEDCRLGKHTPSSKTREGIVKSGKKYTDRVSSDDTSWFSKQGTSAFAQQWQSVARACRHAVVPYVSTTLLEAHSAAGVVDQARFTVVVYVFIPSRNVASTGMPSNQEFTLRCFHEIIEALPLRIRSDVVLQAVPFDVTLDHCYMRLSSEASSEWPYKSLALSIYGQCRPSTQLPSRGKLLTSFGALCWNKNLVENALPRVFTPVFALEETPPLLSFDSDGLDDVDGASSDHWLFCGYSWINDNKLLVAVLTDARGSVLEPTVISVSKSHDLTASQLLLSAFKNLYEFCVDFVSRVRQQFRIVFTRVGGATTLSSDELLAWRRLLTRRRLLATNSKLADCRIAKALPSSYVHSTILSASVVSLEMDDKLRVVSSEGKARRPTTTGLASKRLSPPSFSGKRGSSTLLVFPSDFDAKQPTTFKELSSETIPLGSGSANMGSFDAATAAAAAAAAAATNSTDALDLATTADDLLTSMTSLSKHGGGRESTASSEVDTFLFNPPSTEATSAASHIADFRAEEHSLADTPTDMPFLLSGTSSEEKGADAGPEIGSKTKGKNDAESSLCNGYLFVCLDETGKDETTPTVIKGSLSVCSHTKPLLYQQHLRFIMERYDALSWLGLDLTTGRRSSGLPFHLSVAETLAGEVDGVFSHLIHSET